MGRIQIPTEVSSNSFRDPDGFVFVSNGVVLRQVNYSYKQNYDCLIKSGLYDNLRKNGLLIEHVELKSPATPNQSYYKILKPRQIGFISYPYEWSFGQLKDAALATLKIQRIAIKHDMTLKDASAYNIQFVDGKPQLIDTLSFEKYDPQKPWKPYRQFCQHFLVPLTLASYKDPRLIQMLRIFNDGIPIEIGSKLLPIRALLKPSLFFNIFTHARFQNGSPDKNNQSKKQFSENALMGLIDVLEGSIKSLSLKNTRSVWSNYYKDDSYSRTAFEDKISIVKNFLKVTKPKTLWDLGANDGTFSRLASYQGIETIATDNDPMVVEFNYQKVKSNQETNLLPLVIDLVSPSPSQGFANDELKSFFQRGNPDMIFALALIHHLTISANINLDLLAKLFNKLTKWLVIEFVPKSDPKVRYMLVSRDDIFQDYNQQNFEKKFESYFKIEKKIKLKDSQRLLYLMIQK